MILKRKQSSSLQNASEHAEGMTEFEKHNFTAIIEIIDQKLSTDVKTFIGWKFVVERDIQTVPMYHFMDY